MMAISTCMLSENTTRVHTWYIRAYWTVHQSLSLLDHSCGHIKLKTDGFYYYTCTCIGKIPWEKVDGFVKWSLNIVMI